MSIVKINEKEMKSQVIEQKIKESLLKSEEDIENGRVRAAEDVFEEWKKKYGI